MMQNKILDIGFRGLARDLAILLQCNQERLVVKDRAGSPQMSLG